MNSVSLVGRLTRDPELSFMAGSGTAKCTFTIAVDRNMSKEKKEEAKQKGWPTADFPRIEVWGKQAENCGSFLSKGLLVGVTGSIKTGSYDKVDGTKVYTTDVNAQRVEFLEFKDKNNQGSNDNFNYGVDPSEFQDIELDDDIPF